MIIGDKKDFAVEYSFDSISPKNMGYGRVWIENEMLGTFEDLIYLDGYLLGLLYEFKNAKGLSHELVDLSDHELFDQFSANNLNYGIRGSTFTDNFNIFCYRKGDNIFILWQLIDSGDFIDLVNYKKCIFNKKVPLTLLDEVINQVSIEFQNEGIIKDA